MAARRGGGFRAANSVSGNPATERGADMNPDAMARGLGWFSIGLGLTEVLMPDRLARWLGMEGHEGLIQLYGAREIATGIGCLSQNPPTPYVWGRVAGDALDVATLAPYLSDENPQRGN